MQDRGIEGEQKDHEPGKPPEHQAQEYPQTPVLPVKDLKGHVGDQTKQAEGKPIGMAPSSIAAACSMRMGFVQKIKALSFRHSLPGWWSAVKLACSRPFTAGWCHASSRAYSSSITPSSSFLKSGTGWRSAWPGGSLLGDRIHVTISSRANAWRYATAIVASATAATVNAPLSLGTRDNR